MKNKVIIVTNIPVPYRIDFFNHLIGSYDEYKFEIVYTAKQEENRGWILEEANIKNSIFASSTTITIKKKLDNKHIHVPKDIIKILNTEKPDILIASEYNLTAILSYLWCTVRRKKFISWSDGTLNSEKNINIIQKIIRRILCRNANAFIASSTKTKEAQVFYGANINKIYISYLTVDLNKYLYEKNFSQSIRNLLYVGRLTETKGLELLFKALRYVNCDYQFTIVGDGIEMKRLEQLAIEFKILNKVIFLGAKSGNELKSIYNRADIFILPSKCDCFGLVITEAMCNSLPVIASKYADGVYDLIEEGVTGFVVDPYDTRYVANKIEQLLSDQNKVQCMGEKAFMKVQDFSFEKVSKPFIKAIEDVLK